MDSRQTLHAVCELRHFRVSAISAGMTEEDITALIDVLAEQPKAGTVIKETGGCRKLRFADGQRGKSGGFRIITIFSGEMMPVFLLFAYKKGEKDSLSKSERQELKALTVELVDEYKRRVVPVRHTERKR